MSFTARCIFLPYKGYVWKIERRESGICGAVLNQNTGGVTGAGIRSYILHKASMVGFELTLGREKSRTRLILEK